MEPASFFVALGAVLAQTLACVGGYIAGGSTFPQPLDAVEEARQLRLARAGDERARNVLIERNLRLVAHIVKKFDNTGEDPEDLISIGTIGLIKSIATFDETKGTRLATYAARCIENEILMYLRSIRKNRAAVSLYESIGVDKEGNEITLLDVLGTDPEVVPNLVLADLETKNLYRKMGRLNGRERKVVMLRYGLFSGVKRTQREIAKLLGVSRSYVSRIEKKAVSKLCTDITV